MMNKPAHNGASGQFTIKAVAQATGLTVETLRAWERRYAVVSPSRDASGRRTYSAVDVARLRLLRSATELGHTISRLAPLSADDLAKLVADSGGQARPGPARGQMYVERALDATEHSDPGGVEDALTSAVALLPPNEVVHTVIVPLVREVGERWHRGEVSIAQEHMVTDIVRRLVISVTRGYLRSDNGPCLVLATLSGERHELGILMCSWLAATRRFRTHYLGADCPAEEIARFALEVEAAAVLVSIVMPENEVPALQQLDVLAHQLHNKCEIWLGGFAARLVAADRIPDGCVMLPTGQDFEQRLDLLAAQFPG
ncbi:MAG: MerR family transcriptional regulator [Steroidobacteraceae bacterium]|jgi:DNA-binding transcriptional MerR regulator/methylmalonyl-CoA mutase cobalamin-binding subunit